MSNGEPRRLIRDKLACAISFAVVIVLLLGGCSLSGSSQAASSPAARAVIASPPVTASTETAVATATETTPTAMPTLSPTPAATVSGSSSVELSIQGTPLVLKGSPNGVTSLAWSPDGSLLTAAGGNPSEYSRDLAIRLWRADGTLVATLKGHTEIVNDLAWSPDGQTLASGSADGTVRLWSPDSTFKRTLSGSDQPMGTVLSLAWSPDGSTLAVGYIGNPNGLKGYVGLYQADGRFIRTLPEPVDTGGKFLNLGWSPDGSMLAMGAVGYKIWHPDGTLVGSVYIGGTPQWGFAWAPDGKSFAIGDENGFVERFTPSGTGLQDWQDVGSVDSLAFSPDGTVIALNSHSFLLRLLPVADGQTTPIASMLPSGPPKNWSNISWSRDGLVASGGADGAVYVFNTSGQQVATLRGCDGPIESLAWSGSGELAAGTSIGDVCLWRHP